MLDLQRLRALHAVSVHGTVGAAASALGYTSSAVSQQIAKLERETRTVLLEREGRGVRLTDEAHQLVRAARELIAIVERAETELEERRGVPSGRLTVAAFASAARGLMPPVLADLARRHPALDTRLTEVDPHLSVDLVAKGAVDLVVAHDWDIAPLPAPANVEQTVIGNDLCDLLVPQGHRFAGRTGVRREELAGERWICQPPGRVCHEWLVRTLRAAGHEPAIVHTADENPTLVALVRGRSRHRADPPAGARSAARRGRRGAARPDARTAAVRAVAHGRGAPSGDRGDGPHPGRPLAGRLGPQPPLTPDGRTAPSRTAPDEHPQEGNPPPPSYVPGAGCRVTLRERTSPCRLPAPAAAAVPPRRRVPAGGPPPSAPPPPAAPAAAPSGCCPCP